jgi:tricorn protease
VRVTLPRVFVCLLVTACTLGGIAFAASDGYLRYPDIHGDRIVFVAEADIWTAPVQGGTARRLTTHVGGESLPKFSPSTTATPTSS